LHFCQIKLEKDLLVQAEQIVLSEYMGVGSKSGIGIGKYFAQGMM